MYYDLTEAEREELEEALGQGRCPAIPKEVWEDRISRCRSLMENKNLDALIVYAGGQQLTGREWARYFANYKEPLWNGESFIVVPIEGDVTLIINYPHMVARVLESSHVQDVRGYQMSISPDTDRYHEMLPILLDVLEERGVRNGTIGLGRHGMQGDFYPNLLNDRLLGALDGAHVEDASDLLWDLIAVKTDYDVEMIRRSNAILCDGVDAMYEAIGAGRKEHEYYAAFWEAVCDRGAEVDEAAGCHLDSQSAPGSEIPNRPFSVCLRRMQKGDSLMLDPGVTYRGYVSDIARVAVIGKPSDEQQKIFDVMMGGHARMVDILKPGVTAQELSETWFQHIEKHGYKQGHSHVLQGHGIGFMKNEVPILNATAPPFTMKKGMTLSVETGLMVEGLGRARVEDTYLVTDGEPERLTPGPQDMYIA